MNKTKTIRFNKYNTRRNLPPKTGLKRGESNFLGAFERHISSKLFKTGYGGKNFALSNYGVADLVWLMPQTEQQETRNEFLYAFETKLHNWRRAFQQAYRYSFFADFAVVVLPRSNSEPALAFIDLFKLHDIGLWLFDKDADRVDCVFTPGTQKARNQAARTRAIEKISSRVKFRFGHQFS